MTDYIDIDAPIDFAVYERNGRIQATVRKILEANDAKYVLADVRPVVRAHWNAVKGALHPAETSAVCSNCGFATMIHAQTFYNFCPNCGADMRETNDEEA